MLWSCETCQNKVSTDQYHMTISQAQGLKTGKSHVFCVWTADQVLVLDCRLKPG